MSSKCPNHCQNNHQHPKIRKYGSYYRKSDGRKIQRYQCTRCGLYFSQASFAREFAQNKRHLNYKILYLYSSNMTQRRLAKFLKCTQKTIARKLAFLGLSKRHENLLDRQKHKSNRVFLLQFDDLETFEHTRLKPLSVTMAVEEGTRYILGFEVARMPAKGRIAKRSVKKYGPRKDERADARQRLFRRLQRVIHPRAEIISDSNPHYPKDVAKYFPRATHIWVKGGRGSSLGQGEIKQLEFDPLFSLNHTFAMIRENCNRLKRKTWCTTKKMQPLIDHLELYVWLHNNQLIPTKG
jgi:transposase-like protein